MLSAIEEAELDGTVIKRQHHPLSFSWVEPDHFRETMNEICFDIKDVYAVLLVILLITSQRNRLGCQTTHYYGQLTT